jgi:hypothetical protein
VQKKALGVELPDTAFPGAVTGNTITHHHHYPTTPAAEPLPAQPPADPPPASKYIAVYEQRQPDGTWKEIKREKLK